VDLVARREQEELLMAAEEGFVGGVAVGEERGVNLDAVFGDGIRGLAGGVGVVDIDEAGFHFGRGVEPDGLVVVGIGIDEGQVGDVDSAPSGGKGRPGPGLGCINGREEKRAE